MLHDMFGLPFDEIAPMIDRSPAAARQLASRARRRVKGVEIATPDPDLARQREVVDAFFAQPGVAISMRWSQSWIPMLYCAPILAAGGPRHPR